MKTPKEYIIGFLFALAMLIACSMHGQVQWTDTIPPGPPHPPYTTKTANGDPLPCYTPCRPCSTHASVAVFPIANGALIVGGDSGHVTMIVTDSSSLILFDTCFILSPTVQSQVYYTYPAYTVVTICRDTIAPVSLFYKPFMQVGPPLDTLADYDTLAPCPPLAIDRPKPAATPTEGYTDLLGRYWQSQPIGISFSWALHRKVLKIE